MKKINDLKAKKDQKLKEMKSLVEQVISENRSKDEDETKRYNALDSEVKGIDAQILEFEALDELNKRTGTPVQTRGEEVVPIELQFRDWLKNAVHQGKTSQFNGLTDLLEKRADPILSSTDSAIVAKTVAGGIDILTSPAETFLRKLGVTFYTGLNGQFIVPNMGQDTAAFVAEDASASSGSMSTTSLTLSPRRVTHTQRISKETLVQTNAGVYTSILQNLVNGIWNCVTNDVFDTLETDGATQARTEAANLTYAMCLNLEASLGGLNVNQPAYVTTPSIKAYLKGTASLTNQAPIWQGNEVNGYPAFGVPAANANKLYFGDWSRQVVGQWDGLEIIVDPYKDAPKGQINLTIIGMFDSGCMNPRAFSYITNASIA